MPTNKITTISGTLPKSRLRKHKQYDVGRICEQEGCETVLSRYNKRTHCYNHHGFKRSRVRGEFTS